jgi:streptomycin 6-kinase
VPSPALKLTRLSMKELEKNIINLYGEQGKKWLISLSEVTARIAIVHGLSNLKPVNNLSYNYVLSGIRGSHPIILKLGLDTDALKRLCN